jgi:cytochrome c-type biogenesis protein CcmE
LTLADVLVAAGVWLVAGLVAYAVGSYVVLFYLPSADDLPNGTVADAAFVATAPFVLAVTWLAAVRNRG